MILYLITIFFTYMIIFDTHTHDYFDSFDKDREQMLKDNFENGVKGKVQIGCDKKSSIHALELAKKYNNCWSTVGIHPCHVIDEFDDLKNNFEYFQSILNSNKDKVIGVGETGFDCFHKNNPEIQEKQKISFKKHLEFAKKNNLPVIIHTRNAQKITIDAMQEYKEIIGNGVIHCFSENLEFANIMTKEFGYFLGIGGTSTYKNSVNIREAIKNTPIKFLVTETDSPFLAPQSMRGKRNNSLNINEIIKLIAELKNIDIKECAKILYENALKLFKMKNNFL